MTEVVESYAPTYGTEEAPTFASPTPLDLDEEKRDEIAASICQLYDDAVQQRTSFTEQHRLYDDMFRGKVPSRQGPWEGASDLHVQMPYWLVDAINVRLVSSLWSQTPLVSGKAEEDDDQDAFRNATHFVDWILQPKRMNARAKWALISKNRCIHGIGVGLITYVHSKHKYRTVPKQSTRLAMGKNGIQVDEEGRELANKPEKKDYKTVTQTKYRGSILHPLDWDDLITPIECINLQCRTPDNPAGADWVGIRQWETLSLIWSKREASYPYIKDLEDELDTKEGWIASAPAQDRSATGFGGENQSRARQQDLTEGRSRSLMGRRTPRGRPNPEFEILTWFMPIGTEIDGEDEESECVFFVSYKHKKLVGAYLLSDIYWINERPLLELHYQRVGANRINSMGVCEISKHLSAELDTIHNMRVDVGFATNLPFFFYRATSSVNPRKIELKPMKGVPVDDINDVRFPQMQNVTSFYNQEEQLLYTLIERVMGVTDLFLGMSPSSGAAARHATGFVGTQQEALARTSEVLSQDAEAFAFLCRTVYNMELQYGPQERAFRLLGERGPISQKMLRNDLWMRGEYDFRLGANAGMYSAQIGQERANALLQFAAQNPLVMQDPGRFWEASVEYLLSIGFPNPERFIGPKEAVSLGDPLDQDEENGQMVQYLFGNGVPAKVHPSNDDQAHLEELIAFMGSEEYNLLGRPNFAALSAHGQSHQQQMQQKLQQQQQQAAMAAQQQAGGQPGQQGSQGQAGQPTNARNVAQLNNVGQMGQMGDVSQQTAGGAPNANGTPAGAPTG